MPDPGLLGQSQAQLSTTNSEPPAGDEQNHSAALLLGLPAELLLVSDHDVNIERDNSKDKANQYAPSQSQQPQIKRRIPLGKSLGYVGIITLLGGSILLLVIVGFLVFLWAGEGPVPGGTRALGLWRTIMLQNWAIRTVTLLSVVLRFLTMAQAAICSSLVAALLIERSPVPLSLTAHLSIMRGVNTSPRELLQALIFSRASARLVKLETLILVLLAITTLGIQFSSTILLSSFDSSRLVGYPKQVPLNLLASSERTQELIQSLKGPDTDKLFLLETPEFPTFGEMTISDATTSNEYGVSDSGLTRRAFLPYGQENRTNTRSYEGPAVVADTRISCLRPSLDATIRRISFDRDDSYTTWAVNGTISYEQTYREAGIHPYQTCREAYNNVTCLSSNFISSVLTVPSKWSPGKPEWTAFARPAWIYNASFEHSWDTQQSPLNFSSGSTPFFIFATNLNDTYLTENADIELPLDSRKAYREWNSYEILPDVFFNATLCFVGFHSSISRVTMQRDIDTQEPTIVQGVSGAFKYNEVGEVLDFIGVNNVSNVHGKGSLLSISEFKEITTSSDANIGQGFSTSTIPDLLDVLNMVNLQGWFFDEDSISVQLCAFCTGFTYVIPVDLATIFSHVINSGGQLTPIFGFFLTTIFQRSYYYVLRALDVEASSEVAFSENYSIPRWWGGLSAVMALVFTHLLCVFWIAGLFVARVRFTMQGNIWHAVSQLVSSDTEALLKQSNELKDSEVRESLQGNDVLVTLARVAESGNVSVVRRVECGYESMTTSPPPDVEAPGRS